MSSVAHDSSKFPPVVVIEARSTRVPLVFDSPHSGSHYPDGLKTLVPLERIRRAEDAFVDELFAAAPDYGATLIAATFPRLFLDPNRAPQDFVGTDAIGTFDMNLEPSEKARRGNGIVWTRLHGISSLYDSPLTAEEVMKRIEMYWRPYHRAVELALNRVHADFGRVFHINCHSMRALGNPTDADGVSARPDFVISDGKQITSDPEFTSFISEYLKNQNYTVFINDPYKGADLVHRYSAPEKGRHSVQIEINRKLYMDEISVTKSKNFESFRNVITGLIATLSDYAASEK